jgi:putative intracellular protease/amidase
MVAFPDAQTLDVTGPLEVFAMATQANARVGAGYRSELAAPRRGALDMSSGLRIVADLAFADVRGPLDTLIVAGGEGVRSAIRDRRLLAFLERTAGGHAGRSVCTGSLRPGPGCWRAARATATERAQADGPRYPMCGSSPTASARDGSVHVGRRHGRRGPALALVEEDTAVSSPASRGAWRVPEAAGRSVRFSTQLAAGRRAPASGSSAFIRASERTPGVEASPGASR